MTRREMRCGSSADAGELARLELRALGVDVEDRDDQFCLGYLRALKDQRAEKSEMQ